MRVAQRLRDEGYTEDEIEAELDLLADDYRRDKQDREAEEIARNKEEML